MTASQASVVGSGDAGRRPPGPGSSEGQPGEGPPPTASAEDWRIALQPIPAFVDWYREHKVSGTLLVTVFLIVKGYVIARGDLTTALGIVHYGGVASWVVAAVLSSLPTLAAAMLAIACYQILWPLIGTRRAGWRQMLSVAAAALLLSAALTPWLVWLGAIVLGFLFGGLQWLIYRFREKRYTSALIRPVQITILVGEVCAAVVMLYTVWLPHEKVTFKGQTMVANVLAEDSGGRTTLLDSINRKIVRPKSGDIESINECFFPPRGGFSDIYDGPTPWAWASTHWQLLHDLGPVPGEQCVSSATYRAPPINWPLLIKSYGGIMLLVAAISIIITFLRSLLRC